MLFGGHFPRRQRAPRPECSRRLFAVDRSGLPSLEAYPRQSLDVVRVRPRIAGVPGLVFVTKTPVHFGTSRTQFGRRRFQVRVSVSGSRTYGVPAFGIKSPIAGTLALNVAELATLLPGIPSDTSFGTSATIPFDELDWQVFDFGDDDDHDSFAIVDVPFRRSLLKPMWAGRELSGDASSRAFLSAFGTRPAKFAGRILSNVASR